MTTFYFGGAEAPTHRNRLKHAGARAVSVGMLDLAPRLGEDGEWSISDYFDDDTLVLLDMQGAAASKRGADQDWIEAYVHRALGVVFENKETMDGVVEFDYEPWGVGGVIAGREAFFDHIPTEKFIPVWHPEWEAVEALCEQYSRVAIPGDVAKALTDRELARVRGSAMREGASLHLLGSTDQKMAKGLRVSAVSSSAWTASTAHGETALWERNRVRRYRSEDKEHIRRRKRSLVEAAGVDPDDVISEDPQALVTLQVAAWQSWADHHSRADRPVPSLPNSADNLPQLAREAPAQPSKFKWNGEAPEGMTMLPLLAPEENPETGGYEVSTQAQSMRRCSTCSLAGMCPAYVDDPSDDWCRIAIPVEVRDKSQLSAMLRTFVEMQAQRAMFAKFTEDLEGTGSSAEASREFDRLMSMTEAMKRIMEDTAFLRVTVEASGAASGGVISQLFGGGAGKATREIDPGQAEDVMAEVLDG